MVVTLFLCLLFLALVVGVVFLFAGVFLLIERDAAKKPRAHTLLIISGAIFVFLLGNWLFLYVGNWDATGMGYVNTGKMIEERGAPYIDENGDDWPGSFYVDGECYEPLEIKRSPLCPRGDAVFSYDDKSSDFLDRLFGRYDGRGNLYAVDNALGLDMVRSGYYLWCRADQVAQARAWYRDSSNYQWYFTAYDGARYPNDYTLLEPQPDQEYIDALLELSNRGGEEAEFTVPNGTKLLEYHLNMISTDQVATQRYIFLVVFDGRLGIDIGLRNDGETETYITYPLPVELSDYFLELLSR